MKDMDKKKNQNTNQTKRSVRTPRRDNKSQEENVRRKPNVKDTQTKARPKQAANSIVSETNAGTEPSEVYEDVVIHYVDDAEAKKDPECEGVEDKSDDIEDHSGDFSGENRQVKGDESDFESAIDSSSSQGGSQTGDDDKIDGTPRVKKSANTEESSDDTKRADVKIHPSLEHSERVEDNSLEEVNLDTPAETVNVAEISESDTEISSALKEKISKMENRIEKVEEELREVAALEISLYSVVPEHGSSAHKVHTPARRLSRLYIHASKHWTPTKRASIARNTVSGLILVAKTCGNDVARLTFWLSNTVALREIISQTFGISRQLNIQANESIQLFEDWQETITYTGALEKVESWMFSRVVESVWWQALTPNMLSPVEDLMSQKSVGRLLGPSLGDQHQGTFSVQLWKNAFQNAFQRLCPVRAAGHECGCLPVLARMVMEQCFARLDVAMFNAILRESEHQIPTDPLSDPIVDSRVLPIPAGNLSFGSGAQLKNSVGNWSIWFTDSLGTESHNLSENNDCKSKDDDEKHTVHAKYKSFRLLNELSELLMLPKDMLMDSSIRKEVCPSISVAVTIRVLCNFTPDEFCPDAVPPEVLEALNAESFVDRKLSLDPLVGFPYAAGAVVYSPPSSQDVSEKVAEAGEKSHLDRKASMVQKKGYTSDEELDDLDSPLASITEPLSPNKTTNGKSSVKFKEQKGSGQNSRYQLLREVWSL